MTTTQPVTPSSKVPVPSGLSPEARQYLASADPYGDSPEPTDLADSQAWIRWVESA